MSRRSLRIGSVSFAAAAAALLSSLTFMACSPSKDEGDDTTQNLTNDDHLSYVGKEVIRGLTRTCSGDCPGNLFLPLQGKTWEVTYGNTLGGVPLAGKAESDWLFSTFGSEWWDKLSTLPMHTDCKAGDQDCDADFLMRSCKDKCPEGGGTCVAFAPTATKADGSDVKKMCVGYSDWFEDAAYQAVASAEQRVDITSLWMPDDRFLPAIHNGVLRLADRIQTKKITPAKPIEIRLLSGNVKDELILAGKHAQDVITAVTKGLPAGVPIRVYAVEESSGLVSWNHSKIIAVDGKSALTGGHNMHTDIYQLADPVQDMSMRLTGPAAASAHRYADEVWKIACKRGITSLHANGFTTYPPGLDCPADVHFGSFDPAAPHASGNGNASVISVGRMGAVKVPIGQEVGEASDAALLSMVDSARKTIVMSQEDIFGGRIPRTNIDTAGAPIQLLNHLANAIAANNVDVYVVMSNVDGELFTTGYSHGWSATETAQRMAKHMLAAPGADGGSVWPNDVDPITQLCNKLHVAGIREAKEDRWAPLDGTAKGKVFSNHAKFLMIDTQAFYVGSQNAYRSDLGEFGFIVDSAEAAQQARSIFWDPLWALSKQAAASGTPEVPLDKCPLKGVRSLDMPEQH